jgi:hypothetical protein
MAGDAKTKADILQRSVAVDKSSGNDATVSLLEEAG